MCVYRRVGLEMDQFVRFVLMDFYFLITLVVCSVELSGEWFLFQLFPYEEIVEE